MSINTLEFAQNMTKELDKAAGQKTVTGFLADNSLRARFVGANKVLIPEVEISGLGDYDRDTGFVTGTITVSSTPYTLTMDRGRSFQLDREDNDETGIANLAGQVMASSCAPASCPRWTRTASPSSPPMPRDRARP